MSDAKHTPGPWEIYRDGDIRHIVRAGSVSYPSPAQTQADWIAEINPDGTDHDDETTEANASLIAVAPLLMEFWEAREAWVGSWNGYLLAKDHDQRVKRYLAAEAAVRAALAAVRGDHP